MAPKKKTVKRKVSAIAEVQDSTVASTTDVSSISLNMTTSDQNNRITQQDIDDKKQEALDKINEIEQRAIADVKRLGSLLLGCFTPQQLATPLSLEKMFELDAILNGSFWSLISDISEPVTSPSSSALPAHDSLLPAPVSTLPVISVMPPPTAGRDRRRSASADRSRLRTIVESPAVRPSRSSSAGRNKAIMATPANAASATPLGSRLLTATKYTVRKPPTRTIPVRRVMRAGEEAISTAGSPLFVQQVPSEPEINIPLSNGGILSFATSSASGNVVVPALDAETQRKIRFLCQKLQEVIS